jgi:hypothetical protein
MDGKLKLGMREITAAKQRILVSNPQSLMDKTLSSEAQYTSVPVLSFSACSFASCLVSPALSFVCMESEGIDYVP